MRGETQLLSARSVRWIDIGVAVWIVVWAALGVLIWHDVRAQSQLSGNVIKIGTAVKETGEALGVVGGLPLVGGRIGEFASGIEQVGTEVETSGEDSRAGVVRAGVIAGLCVGVFPAALALFLYVPVRVRWRRDVTAVAQALPGTVGNPAFEHYLARRAIDTLPWNRLCTITADPWAAVAAGDYRALADAELARLGLSRR